MFKGGISRYKMDPETDCHLWQGYKSPDGYGRIAVGGKSRMAHRVSYEARFGKIIEGMEIHHTCRNRDCINPDHLSVVTHDENMAIDAPHRKGLGAKTHCLNGHEYAAGHGRLNRYGWYSCRECQRLHKPSISGERRGPYRSRDKQIR